jgi:hypothetical protein
MDFFIDVIHHFDSTSRQKSVRFTQVQNRVLPVGCFFPRFAALRSAL